MLLLCSSVSKSFILSSLHNNIPLNTKESAIEIDNRLSHVTEIDWEKRNWKRILTPEEEREIAVKMLRLNGGPEYNPAIERLLAAASSTKKKPTLRIKRLGSDRLKSASSISNEREKAEKALRLNGI
jgi:hypothetical protein